MNECKSRRWSKQIQVFLIMSNLITWLVSRDYFSTSFVIPVSKMTYYGSSFAAVSGYVGNFFDTCYQSHALING